MVKTIKYVYIATNEPKKNGDLTGVALYPVKHLISDGIKSSINSILNRGLAVYEKIGLKTKNINKIIIYFE